MKTLVPPCQVVDGPNKQITPPYTYCIRSNCQFGMLGCLAVVVIQKHRTKQKQKRSTSNIYSMSSMHYRVR